MSSRRAATVIVTVPHATGQLHGHGLDVVANDVALELISLLRETKLFNVIYLRGDIARKTCDLNRRRDCSELTDFQQRYATELRNKPLFVVDMHSFPNEHRWTTMSNIFQPAVLLFEHPNKRYARDLARTLGVPALQAAPGVNALIYSAHRVDVNAALLEINEFTWRTNRAAIDTILRHFVEYLTQQQ